MSSTDVYFAGPEIDADLASMYGGDGTYGSLSALFQPTLTSGPSSGDWGLGSQLQEPGYTAADMPAGVTGTNYNGIRWFDGPSPQNNEVHGQPDLAAPAAPVASRSRPAPPTAPPAASTTPAS